MLLTDSHELSGSATIWTKRAPPQADSYVLGSLISLSARFSDPSRVDTPILYVDPSGFLDN